MKQHLLPAAVFISAFAADYWITNFMQALTGLIISIFIYFIIMFFIGKALL